MKGRFWALLGGSVAFGVLLGVIGVALSPVKLTGPGAIQTGLFASVINIVVLFIWGLIVGSLSPVLKGKKKDGPLA
jgi:hypothetical protein